MEPKKIAIITNIIPSYREGFYDRLLSREELIITVYCQDHIPGANLRVVHQKYPDNVQVVKFASLKKEKAAWQFLPWRKVLTNYDVIIVGGNPRVLSDLLLATSLRIFRKRVVLWTAAHSYNARLVTEKLRLIWSRFFDFILVYTDAEVNYLRKRGFSKNFILGMNNGLDQKKIEAAKVKWSENRLEEWRRLNGLERHILILSCARLEKKNGFKIVVEALPLMIAKIPNLIWCVIGDGDEKYNLASIINRMGFSNHVRFIGQLYDESELASWFMSSTVFVHPESIGLSLLHAFGYGLPVVTHGNATLHGPEYAAFEPGINGENFLIGNHESLADVIVNLVHNSQRLANMKNEAIKVARESYNVDIMVDRFVEIVEKVSASER